MSSRVPKNLLVIVLVVITAWLVYASGIFNPISKPPSKKPKTIGVIYQRQQQLAYDGLKATMNKLGYTDKDIKYDEVLVTQGTTYYQDIENGAKKLIADKVDVFFVTNEQIAKTVLEQTKGTNFPIVFMTRFHDPLAYGLIDSYKSSGNNSTGVATNLAETVQKNLFFFKEINPKIKKIGVFGEGFQIPNFSDAVFAEAKKQAPKLGLTIVEYTTKNPPDATSKNWYEVANKIKPGDIDGILHLPGHYYDKQEVDETTFLANRLHLPHSVPAPDMPTGGSFSFSTDFTAAAGQAAVMVDKIFKGAKPADIPIEFGSKSTLMLNLKRASDAGFKFPNSMLSIAEVKIDGK